MRSMALFSRSLSLVAQYGVPGGATDTLTGFARVIDGDMIEVPASASGCTGSVLRRPRRLVEPKGVNGIAATKRRAPPRTKSGNIR